MGSHKRNRLGMWQIVLTAVAGLCLAYAIRQFSREEVLFRT